MTDCERHPCRLCSPQCKAKKFLKTPDKVLPLHPISDFYINHGIDTAKKGSQARAKGAGKLFSTWICLDLTGENYYGHRGQNQSRSLPGESISQHFPL